MPIHTAPCTWPSTASGLIAKPQSCATQTLSTCTTPVSVSTLTSTACAAYEKPAVEPTAAPRNLPPWVSGGVDHAPLTVIVPLSASAASTTWLKFSSRSVPTTLQHSPAQSICSGPTSSLRAAASTSRRLSDSAARSAALPTMKDTRDEYEPLSFGVSALSVAITRMRASGSISTSATTCASSVDDPWPMSDAPVRMVMPASKSSFRLTTACGSPLQCTGLAEPET